MLSNFPKIINQFLGELPKNDYPVLDTFKFVSCWLSFVMDQSQSSMRDLFKRLNVRGIDMDISTGASHFLLLNCRINYQEPVIRWFNDRGYFYISEF